MKSLIIGFGIAVAAAVGATFLVLQSQPKCDVAVSKDTEIVSRSESETCAPSTCPTCTNSSTVYDVADLKSIYSAPIQNIEAASFEEPPLAPKREVLPPPRESK